MSHVVHGAMGRRGDIAEGISWHRRRFRHAQTQLRELAAQGGGRKKLGSAVDVQLIRALPNDAFGMRERGEGRCPAFDPVLTSTALCAVSEGSHSGAIEDAPAVAGAGGMAILMPRLLCPLRGVLVALCQSGNTAAGAGVELRRLPAAGVQRVAEVLPSARCGLAFGAAAIALLVFLAPRRVWGCAAGIAFVVLVCRPLPALTPGSRTAMAEGEGALRSWTVAEAERLCFPGGAGTTPEKPAA